MGLSMAQDNRIQPGTYGESKQQKQFLITPTASEKLDAVAGRARITRSEAVERLIRWADNTDHDWVLKEVFGVEAEEG
ncbi:MAG TPA: hypothetical protein V6D06_05210 [Trichocoleus sp.]